MDTSPQSSDFITIDNLILQLVQIKEKHGNLVCVTQDGDSNIFTPSLVVNVLETAEYVDDGFYTLGRGEEKIACIRWGC